MRRKSFGCTRDEVTGGRRRLHNEDLYVLHCPPNILVMNSRRMRWAGHMAHMGEKGGAYGDLMRKPEGTRPLGRPRHRREDIKMDLQEVEWWARTGLIWLRKGTGGGRL
jgi:hypothetical protein